MNGEILSFMSNIMLAQAQECILEKSMLDQRKNTIVAKVSYQNIGRKRLCQVLPGHNQESVERAINHLYNLVYPALRNC
jgi:hypothetical protein